MPDIAQATTDARKLAADIMAAMRRAKFPKEYPAEAHDEFEALTLVPMLSEALAVSSKAGDDVVLPCDVQLPPATTIVKGCKLSTLIHALELRGMAALTDAVGTLTPRGERD